MKVKINCINCGISIEEDVKKFKEHKFKSKGETYSMTMGHNPTHIYTYKFIKDVKLKSVKCPACNEITPLLNLPKESDGIEGALDKNYTELISHEEK